MDLSVLIIGVITLLIFVVPFLLANLSKNNKAKRIKQNFINEANKMKMQIAESDIWNSCYCIGIDTIGKKLLYCNNNSSTAENILIDLKDISRCKVVNTTRTIKSNNQRVDVTDAISLAFNYKNSSKPDSSIEIYNAHSHEGATIAEAPKIAQKWEGIINNIVIQ